MEEEKNPQRTWIRTIGMILQFVSVIAVLAMAAYCTKQGIKDNLYYDSVKGILLPPKGYDVMCYVFFWMGFAGGMLVIGYEILRQGEKLGKVIGAVVAILCFLLTIFANAFIATTLFVDEGLGFQPSYEADIKDDEGLLTVYCKEWQTVQVYYVFLNDPEPNEATWVDGYDMKEPARVYEVHGGPNGFGREKEIYVYSADHEEHHSTLIYPATFP